MRTCSGTSRWISASRLSLASAWENPATAERQATRNAPKKTVAATATPTSTATTVTMMISGARALSAAPTAVPQAFPMPAATATMPSDTAALCPVSGCSRIRKARKKMRKPASQRVVAFTTRAWVTAMPTVLSVGRLTGLRCGPCRCSASAASSAVSSPLAESTFGGSEKDRTVPAMKITQAP
ncbi:hypothetical protein SGLAM104S_08177 [Streptomyces glaucescens]